MKVQFAGPEMELVRIFSRRPDRYIPKSTMVDRQPVFDRPDRPFFYNNFSLFNARNEKFLKGRGHE